MAKLRGHAVPAQTVPPEPSSAAFLVWDSERSMEFRQLRRPSRFTVRELLVLVASDLDHTEQREYVKQVFSWYFHREHVFLVAVSAGCVGLALATGQAANPIAVAVVFALLGALGFVVQIVLAPLHREYLCCLVLLQRLD